MKIEISLSTKKPIRYKTLKSGNDVLELFIVVVDRTVADCTMHRLHCRAGVGSTSRRFRGIRWLATLLCKCLFVLFALPRVAPTAPDRFAQQGDSKTGAKFPYNGNYSAFGGAVSPVTVALKSLPETARFGSTGEPSVTVQGLPSCTLLQFGLSAYSYAGLISNLNASVAHPCASSLAGCQESVASNIVNATGSLATDVVCSVRQRASASDAVVVQCAWNEPLFGGTAATFWRQVFALKDVPSNSSADVWDGMASEGASPVVLASPVASSALTFPAATTGRFCTVLSASCAADRTAAIAAFSKRTYNTTCIDIPAFADSTTSAPPVAVAVSEAATMATTAWITVTTMTITSITWL